VTVAAVRPVTDAIIALLDAADGVPAVGDGRTPDGAGQTYIVVQPVGGILTGPSGDPFADGRPEVQLTSWGLHRRMAEETRDRVRAALLVYGALTVDGYDASWVELLGSTGVRRDDTTGSPSLWQAVDTFRIHTTPHAS
jgi:hypothetical protein